MSVIALRELSVTALRAWVLAQAPRLPTPELPLLLAVSGGIDSMTLWHLVREAGLPHAVSHVAYGLRGAESQAEADLVAELAAEHGVQLYLNQVQLESKAGLQNAARRLRRGLWEQLSPQHAAILLGHQADDQAETVLMRLSRGTGPEGLCGMAAVAPPYLRPLLGISRKTISAFAKTHGVRFREDSSNARLDYHRNRFRHLVLAPLQAIEARTVPGISLSTSRQADLLSFAKAQVDRELAAARLSAKPRMSESKKISPEVTDGPYSRNHLAQLTGLVAALGLWLNPKDFASDTIEQIGSAIQDEQSHRRHYLDKSKSAVCIIAGQHIWIEKVKA